MTYSTIKRKHGPCADCGIKTILIAGRCLTHYRLHRASVNKTKRVVFVPATLSDPTDLDLWFRDKELLLSKHPFCTNCGTRIPALYYRHAVAHIFPKAHFPSVQTHPDNYLFLAAGCCHDKSHRLDTFSKMGVWPEAVKRYLRFAQVIKEPRKYHDLFRSYAGLPPL